MKGYNILSAYWKKLKNIMVHSIKDYFKHSKILNRLNIL